MEDYKKKYENALNAARKFKNDCPSLWDTESNPFRGVFEELKESEDEKIRKSLIGHLKECRNNTRSEVMIGEYAKWIAWLEKQGEKIDVIENFDTEFEKQVSHLIASTINKEHEYNQGYVKWTANALLNYAKHELEKQDEHKCDCKYVGCHVNNMKRWCHKKQSEILNEKCNIKCSEYLKQCEQNPAWSEEDKNAVKVLMNTIKKSEIIDSIIYTDSLKEKLFDWLKSLKERVQPQPKQEWSEEDEKHHQGCLNLMKFLLDIEPYPYYNDYLWLKSIKDRYTWEPSNKQIGILEQWLRNNRYEGDARYCYPIFDSLYQDLKKLRER